MAQALNKTGRPIVFGTEWAAKLAEAPWLVCKILLGYILFTPTFRSTTH